ncbi:hypothetical protein A7A78_05750 [Aequorivita soesokkakensis]|jgi:hypothetical protein|uniref:Uncharacterized protein n=1 Tax=Aequorivita soesokkakensis TaxID=1385699 RepID=A0A1A9LCD4_9FLAO|nr:hypothetical protein [Aequorivita soesokkakensis]OAD90421.1 hypothetical protein A7A78_05750 [Aequorivita soesokkakensis]
MQIYDHDSPETITFKNNSIELDNWINHLEYIEKEISNLLNLSKAELLNAMDQKPVLMRLSIKKEENRNNLNAFRRYKDGLPQAAECEDVDCDMFYVTEHERYRKVYMYHLEKYRRVKEEYFSILSK